MERKMAIFGLVGKSGFGREVMPLIEREILKNDIKMEAVFVDIEVDKEFIGGNRLIHEQDFLNKPNKKLFNVAIADSRIRREIVKKYLANSCKPKEIISENAVILDRVSIEEGAIICSYAHLTSDITIGKYFHCNIYSYVSHDCVIGDYVTFAPNVCCSGNVLIEDNVRIGTGAIIKQGKPGNPIVIGEGAFVGMGAVVTKNVPAHSVVIGNPAREMREVIKRRKRRKRRKG